ncbi:alpha/beta hydrolase [Pseudomonas sp. App30]|uniref:alpha/beta hydrolase n=1 Tax=Pseudomonas sp. App30 TaxID=3068990 RepID=UPI003A7FF3EF
MGVGDASFVLGNGPVAVLLIHGLTGTPTELRKVAQGLAKAGYTVYVPTLAGHCGDNADLQATTWRDWYASALSTFEGIRKVHEQVFVGGLSMGAVLSMHLAAQRPGEVAGLLLYSTTLRYDGWNMPWVARMTNIFMAIPFGVHICRFNEKSPYGIKNPRLRAIVEKQMKAGESANAGLLTMSGISVRELHRLVAEVKRGMPTIKAPALVLHSSEDDITSRWNADYIEAHIGGPVTKVLLDDCYHMITVDLQYPKVISLSAEFIQLHAPGLAQAS